MKGLKEKETGAVGGVFLPAGGTKGPEEEAGGGGRREGMTSESSSFPGSGGQGQGRHAVSMHVCVRERVNGRTVTVRKGYH